MNHSLNITCIGDLNTFLISGQRLSKINKALKAKLWQLWYCVTDGTKDRQPIVAVTQAFEVAFHMTSRILLVFPVIAYGHSFLNSDNCNTAGTPIVVTGVCP